MITYKLIQYRNIVKVLFKNNTNSNIRIVSFESVFDSSVGDCLQVLDSSGTEIDYLGPHRLFDRSSLESGLNLEAGAVGQRIINVASTYNISNGTYKCDIRKNISAFFTESDLRKLTGDSFEVQLQGEAIEVSFTGINREWDTNRTLANTSENNESCKPICETDNQDGLKFIINSTPCESVPLCHPSLTTGIAIGPALCWRSGIVGGAGAISHPVANQSFTYDEKTQISEITTSISALFIHYPTRFIEKNATYTKWFGKFNQARFDKFLKTFLASRPRYCKPCFFSPRRSYLPDEDQRTIAQTVSYSGSDKFAIQVFPKFWAQPFWGPDSKVATIVHEYSHGQGLTNRTFKPEVYGQTACLELAREKPDKAILNAANYAYYFFDAVKTFNKVPIRPYPVVGY